MDLFASSKRFCAGRLCPTSIYCVLHADGRRLFPDQAFAALLQRIGPPLALLDGRALPHDVKTAAELLATVVGQDLEQTDGGPVPDRAARGAGPRGLDRRS